MDIVEIRRARLREFFAGKTLPPKEKSYLSQLMNGTASFGERAARRLEAEFGMGDGYLDRTSEAEQMDVAAFLSGPGTGYVNADEIIELILLYKQASQKGRNQILMSARVAERTDKGSRAATANNKL